MTDRVYPSSKPITTTPIPTTTTLATAATTKPQQQQARYLYRLQPQYDNHHHRRINCYYCCFWSLFVLLALALLLAIASSTLYVLYHPQKPHFSITSLCIAKLNLTTNTLHSSPTASHLNSLFNLKLTSKNPNSHIVFFYDTITLMAFSTSFVQLANGSILAFVSNKNNETSFRAIMTESKDTTKEKKYNRKGGLFSFNVSEIVRFNFFFHSL